MPRKKADAPYLIITVASEGIMLLTVKTTKPVAQISPTFGADVFIKNNTRKAALATTLCEVAAHLVRDSATAHKTCQDAAAACVIADGWMGLELDTSSAGEIPF